MLNTKIHFDAPGLKYFTLESCRNVLYVFEFPSLKVFIYKVIQTLPELYLPQS